MADSKVASRYAKSLLSLAIEQRALDEVHQDMQQFDKICQTNRAFLNLLKSPIIRHEKKKQIFDILFKGRVHPLTMAILDIITSKNREPLLPSIASEFHMAYNAFKGIGKATVTTTITMDEKLKSEIERMIRKMNNLPHIELEQKIDRNLIGGFVLNVGDRQIDASIKNKLRSLKVKFSENSFLKEV